MKKETLNSIIKNYTNNCQKLDTNPFGSCQYNTIYLTFELCQELIQLLGYQEFLTYLGISHGNPKPLEQLQQELYQEQLDQLKELIESYPEDQEQLDEFLSFYPTSKEFTLEEYFNWTKQSAWDLWSAYLAPITFLENYQQNLTIDKSPTFGPAWNQLAQEDNTEIGVALALLSHHYNIDMDCYADYDT